LLGYFHGAKIGIKLISLSQYCLERSFAGRIEKRKINDLVLSTAIDVIPAPLQALDNRADPTKISKITRDESGFPPNLVSKALCATMSVFVYITASVAECLSFSLLSFF